MKAVRIRDLVMSAAAIAVLVALIALTDDRVRDRIGELNARAVSHRVANETTRVESATVSARDLAIDNGALAIVVVAGAVLFVCMLRT